MLWHAVGVDTRRHVRSGDLDRRRDQSSGRLCLRNFRTGSTAVSSARRRFANTTATNSTPGQVKASAKVAESLFRKAVGDGPQSVFCARPYGQFRGTTQADGLKQYLTKRFCRSMPVGTPVDVSSWPIALFATTQHFSRFRGKADINSGQVGKFDARVSCPRSIASRLWEEGSPTDAVPGCLFTIENYLFRENN